MPFEQASEGAAPLTEEADGPFMDLESLETLIREALLRAGLDTENAAPITATVLSSEMDGVPSHGLLRLPGFVDAVRTGWADGRVRPRIVTRSGAIIVVDAGNGFAQPALEMARGEIGALAREGGVAMLLVRDAHHFGALAPDVEPLAADGFVALTCVNSRKRMNVWGSGVPVVGTNAMAFAAPRAGRPPLVWDQSSSVMSHGDVLLAAREGREVPPGTGHDRDGRPTTSADAILAGGSLSPFGGNKGASIAVMVEILAGALTGSPLGFEDLGTASSTIPSKGGQFLLVVDPARAGVALADRIETLAAAIVGAGALRLPGDRRYEVRRKSLQHGVRVGGEARRALFALAGRNDPKA